MKKISDRKLSPETKSRHNRGISELLVLLVPLVYIVAVSVYMVYHRAWFSPDQFFALAILAVIFIGRIKQFLWDWVPVLSLLFGYEYLRGIVPVLTQHAHTLPLIKADSLIFGFIPTIKLQMELFSPAKLQWYDYLAVILYVSHFIIPMLVAFVFWLFDRKLFKKYTWAFLILSYLAFFTYIIFPATPPWMASAQGYLPPLNKIMDQVLSSFAHPISVPSIYQFFGANLVAAFPSLHAAYPWLIFLFLRQKFHRLSYISLLYVLGVWFAVIYLGEHYFIDVVAGVVYSSIAYLIIEKRSRQKLKLLLSRFLKRDHLVSDDPAYQPVENA